ncbi:tail fiber assembly protein [Photorhabdus tasmaniensis]|uniref:Phage tail protein n=1 Tax=Photorhabdus tasmaniensis TaxID=1004159 RepID=A0ABX0GLT0_9GAMM|nr:tail fiber assembly protein [Photorhabdus tasmaniensis]NHB89181.1 phage tail protein [Photorhabdus tasmaniensis]
MYYYSAKMNAFYPVEMKQDYIDAGSFPDDVIEVSESVFIEFVGNAPPKGKCRIADKNGLPAWGDIPPMTQEQLVQQFENTKKRLISEVSEKILPLQDAFDLGIASEAEKSDLLALKNYRVMLNRTDLHVNSDVKWPKEPG